MDVTESGSVRFPVKAVHPRKVLSPISVTPEKVNVGLEDRNHGVF